MAYKAKFQITNKINDTLFRIERARGYFDAIKFSENLLSVLRNRAMLDEACHTVHMEGYEVDPQQFRKALQMEEQDGLNEESAQKIANYTEAFYFIKKVANKNNIDESIIRGIYKKLIKPEYSEIYDEVDEYRSKDREVNLSEIPLKYNLPEATDISVMMKELIEYTEQVKNVSPIILAGIVQFQIIYIQPFIINNGVLGRILSLLCLYKGKYDFNKIISLNKYYDLDKEGYYNSIQNSIENGMDMTEWLEYFVKAIEMQIKEVQKIMGQYQKYEELQLKNKLTNRQVKAIKNIILYDSITIKKYQKLYPDLTKRTLQTELKKLINTGIIGTRGESTNREYYLNNTTQIIN